MEITAEFARRMALQAIELFRRSREAPPEVERYSWHWVPFSLPKARIKLDEPVLKQRWKMEPASNIASGVRNIERHPELRLTIDYAVIQPKWEAHGRATEKADPTKLALMSARIGWDESLGVAVLFYLDGSDLLEVPLVLAGRITA